MRVLNPGPGEIADRLGVVARKIVEGGDKDGQFKNELYELLYALYDGQRAGARTDWVEKCIPGIMLDATNAAIWQLEDRVREFRNGRPPETTDFSQLTFRIQVLNDRRAKLVKEINAQYGVVREEKL